MKKFLCVMLCAIMVCTSATAFAALEYTLTEKWQRQVEHGNGIKGSITVNVNGQAEWAQLLAPLNDVPLQIRAIHDDDLFQYRLYAEDGESMVGLTQLYGDKDTVYLMSDLLPEILLCMTTGGDVVDRLTGGSEGTNPSLYSAMLNIASVPETSWEGKWLPALAAYEANLELWLEDYASAPSVSRGEQGATVLMRYDVPADAVKAQIKMMWQTVLQDGTLLPLLRTQMNEEQQAAFLNSDLMYYYDQVIDALPLEGNVVLEREMTAKGEIIRTDMLFPLAMGGWKSIRLVEENCATTLSLKGAEMSLEMQLEEVSVTRDSNGYKGKVRFVPAGGSEKGLAADFTLVEIRSASVDADTRSHEVTTWTVKITPDAACAGESWLSFEPVELNVKKHIHSKSMQYNAVSLDIDLNAKMKDAEISVVLDLITHSKWVMDKLPTQGAVEISTLAEGELAQLLTDMGLNGITRLVMMNEELVIPMPQEEIVEEATATDIPATATDIPATETDMPATATDIPATETDIPTTETDLWLK